MRAAISFDINIPQCSVERVSQVVNAALVQEEFALASPVRVAVDPLSIEEENRRLHAESVAIAKAVSDAGPVYSRPRFLCSGCYSLASPGEGILEYPHMESKRPCDVCGTMVGKKAPHGSIVLSNAKVDAIRKVRELSIAMSDAGDRHDGEECDRLEPKLEAAIERLAECE